MHVKTLSSVQSSLLRVSSVQVRWSKVENNDTPSKSIDYNLQIIVRKNNFDVILTVHRR